MNKRLWADLSLIGVAAVWGLTFVVVKNALGDIAPFTFNAIRFAIAFLFMLPFALSFKAFFKPSVINAGFLLGLFLFGGYSFQTVGLLYTSATNAGFITGMSVVLVPLLTAVHTRSWPSLNCVAGVGCAALGLALLTLENSIRLNWGDFLVFLCALSFAGHIFFVGRFTKVFSTTLLVTIQIGAVSLLSGAAALVLETQRLVITGQVGLALLITAVPATALAFFIQNWAQKTASPTRTAIIFALEPIFAALAAFWLLGELLSVRHYFGALLILCGMLLVEAKGFKTSKSQGI
ncbi:MAG: DMT family transporter [Bacillota bacterium]